MNELEPLPENTETLFNFRLDDNNGIEMNYDEYFKSLDLYASQGNKLFKKAIEKID